MQVETLQALNCIDEIAAVDGVDGVFFGPADLSADMGLFGQPRHDDVVAAIKQGHEKVSAAGKPSGILVGDPVQARFWLETGFTFVA